MYVIFVAMKVEKEINDKWLRMFTHGDIPKIRAIMPESERVSKETIRRQLKDGRYTNLAVLKAVSAYYKGKEIDLNEALGS